MDQVPTPPEWLAPGERVAGITIDDAVHIYTVERHTATQIVMQDSEARFTFRLGAYRQVGSSGYGRMSLAPLWDPRVKRILAERAIKWLDAEIYSAFRTARFATPTPDPLKVIEEIEFLAARARMKVEEARARQAPEPKR